MYREALEAESSQIFSQLKYFKNFYLAGGTALALQIGHRISVDFDLFSPQSIPEKLLKQLNRVFRGHRVITAVNNSDELTAFIDDKKITFLHYPFLQLRPYVQYRGVQLLSIPEIAATKAYTIGRRGSYKDYVDLYFILREHRSSLPKIIKLATRKYHKEFHARLFLEQLLYLDDVRDTAVMFLKKEVLKGTLKKFFEQEVRKIQL